MTLFSQLLCVDKEFYDKIKYSTESMCFLVELRIAMVLNDQSERTNLYKWRVTGEGEYDDASVGLDVWLNEDLIWHHRVKCPKKLF